jgi:hypothetical protein
MTLSTHVYLLTEADPADVFMKCRDLLGATEATTWEDDREVRRDEGVTSCATSGPGLPALLWVRYREGAMVQPENEPARR